MNDTLSRRRFLWWMALVGAAGVMQLPTAAQSDDEATAPLPVVVPPCLMLHSRESREGFIDGLMKGIAARDWNTITYAEYFRRARAGESVDGCVIISIDDITGAADNLSFDYFARMKTWIERAGGTAVFGVITAPDKAQDPARWDAMAQWVRDGFELATHTANHFPFNEADGRQRRDLSQEVFDREIAQSAQFIQDRLAERDVLYQVTTLITPFGSGWHRETAKVFEAVHSACVTGGIRMVAGIVDGRAPVPADAFDAPESVIYMGRTPPGYLASASGGQTLDTALTLAYLEQWMTQNARYAV